MEDKYFNYVAKRLSYDEILILGILKDNDANTLFKSMSKNSTLIASDLSFAKFRKIVDCLASAGFLSIDTSNKSHRLYLTKFGEKALNYSLGEVR